MEDQSQEIIFIISVGASIALLLVGFIISILFFYQSKQIKQERLIRDLKERFERELLNSQLEMQENTMKQIGEELHDNIKQQLLVVSMSLGFLPIEPEDPSYKTIKESKVEINNIIKDIAQLSHSLHTDRIFQVGLLESIDLEVERLRRIKTLKVNYSCRVKYNYFDGQTNTFIFRIMQEMLQNVLKHAKATELTIEIYEQDVIFFVIKIQDNGVGFDMNAGEGQSKTGGIGLISMQNRANLINAAIKIESEKGKGTTVSLALPIPKEESSIIS